MACKSKGNCTQAYRKGGADGIHCRIQTENGGRWDYCKHQYMCLSSNRYELSKEADICNLPLKAEQPKEVKIEAAPAKPAVEEPKKPAKKTKAKAVTET